MGPKERPDAPDSDRDYGASLFAEGLIRAVSSAQQLWDEAIDAVVLATDGVASCGLV